MPGENEPVDGPPSDTEPASYAVIGGAQLNAGLFSTRSESPAPTDGARSWPLYDLLRKRWEQFRSTGDDSKTPS